VLGGNYQRVKAIVLRLWRPQAGKPDRFSGLHNPRHVAEMCGINRKGGVELHCDSSVT
jgi:hypothetical protein